jgi:ribosomal protein L11 methyltransferase
LRELCLTVDAEVLERTESLLTLAGAASVSIQDAGDIPVLEPEPGQMPVWPVVDVRAVFAEEIDLEAVAAVLRTALGAATAVRIANIGDDWQLAWRQRVHARRFGARLVLVPAEEPAPGADALRLHMGLAFGTGEHPTTALCLTWLDGHVAAGTRVLDYGCGSGVLALAALKLGAHFAYAVDNDPQALAATRDNARLNELDSLWIGPPESLPTVKVDLIVANILAGPLERLAHAFALHAGHGCQLALSGILEAQAKQVQSAYAPFFDGFDCEISDGWARLTAQRNDTEA